MSIDTANLHNMSLGQPVNPEPSYSASERLHREHLLSGMVVLALESTEPKTIEGIDFSHADQPAEVLHGNVQLADPDYDSQLGARTNRLPCLERRNFDPENAHLRLELYSGHSVFITPLDAFDTQGSTVQHPLPVEFSMFADRRTRLDNLVGSQRSTAGQDRELKKAGRDVDGGIFTTIDWFLKNNQRGQNILEAMGVQDVRLENMSPKETIYLIGYLMHELTNYQHDALQYRQGDALADRQNSLTILHNGISAPNKRSVRPLGVCRNFADVGEALFNAFKSQNPKLTNIYCHNAGGYGGATTGELHKKGENWNGHAWLDFIAVGKEGHMAITTVDPTWTRRNGRSLAMYDMTDSRIGTHTRNIFAGEKTNYVSRKERNLDRIKTYYEDQVDKRVGLMKRQHSDGGPVNLNDIPPNDIVLNSAMYYAVDYIISAAEFGGSTFGLTKDALSKQVLMLVKFAAEQPDIIFSPAEYAAVRHGLHKYMTHSGVSVAGRKKLEKIDSDLEARYAQYSEDSTYKKLFTANEG